MDKESLHHLHPKLLRRARDMRQDSAPAEERLWQRLRARQLNGFKFRRQQPLGPYIADFYCSECNLIIELDGDSHAPRSEYDALRTQRLQRDGHHVIRFLNCDMYDHLDAVLEEILKECEARSAPPSNASDSSTESHPSP